MHNKLSKVWLTRADECFQVNFPPKKLWRREVSKSNGSNITLAMRDVRYFSLFLPSFLSCSGSAFIHDVCAASIPYTLCRRALALAPAHASEHFIMRLVGWLVWRWERAQSSFTNEDAAHFCLSCRSSPKLSKFKKTWSGLVTVWQLFVQLSSSSSSRRPNPLSAPPHRLKLIL